MQVPKRHIFDYIIIGAGSAGCVLAHRLSENPNTKVLLVEAGGEDKHIVIQMPAALAIAARHPKFDWAFLGNPEPFCDERRILQHRGKVLGGSSSINGLVANRGNPRDYDAWAREGLPNWSYSHCLKYFKKLETFSDGPNEWRGGSGPQSIERCPATHSLYQAFLQSGEQAGYDITKDQNGARQEGFHVAQSFTRKGKRCSAADAYLHPIRDRDNLTILTHTLTQRILFDDRRAVGIEAQTREHSRCYEAAREVILSAGAIGSPQLLMLSGVGDPAHLRTHDIPIIADVPAVGKNLEDHPVVPIQYSSPDGLSISHRFRGLRPLGIGLKWILFKSGLGTSLMSEAGCFFRSSEEVEYADIQHEFYPLTAEMGSQGANFDDGFMFSMGLMRPNSRGQVSLRSADPSNYPSIVYNYFASERDRKVMINGLRLTREMAKQEAFDGLRRHEIAPGSDVTSDKEILAWLRSNVSSEYHPCSTCRMGASENSVTNGEGFVHETDGLRVVDASIMPHNVTANLNAPVIMIAEKISDMILGRPPPQPTNQG